MDDFSFLGDVEPSKKIIAFSQAKTFNQLGILVLDGSGSMKVKSKGFKTLAEHVETAVTQFVDWFKTYSSIKSNISLAIVTFDDIAKEHTSITPIVDMDSSRSFNPILEHGNGTEITHALEEAYRIAQQHLNHPEAANIPHSVVILLMSDGLTNRAEQAIQTAEEIKQNPKITICSTYFENPHPTAEEFKNEAINVLKGIASGPEYYRDTADAEELRQFFISSVSARKKYPNSNAKGNSEESSIFDRS